MNLYGLDYSLLDLGFSDQTLIESLTTSSPMSGGEKIREGENSIAKNNFPQHRHDGFSPLPLGMDWSPSPRYWDGPNTVWPHDFHTGWSYCVTIPSWTVISESEGSDPVVFYRVQVGLQSPEGFTTIRGVLRRFSDFLKLAADIKSTFPNKKLPPAPLKGLLRMKKRELLEDRRCSLEDWMAKLLSDIDISRSVPAACFLELEAAARSSFGETSHHLSNINLNFNSGTSSLASFDSTYETPEVVTPSLTEATVNESWSENENAEFPNEISESMDAFSSSDFQFSHNTLFVLPTDDKQKMNRFLTTIKQRLITSRTDMEDLIARLNQEIAVRKYLTTKVKDLEIELESTRKISKENLEQAILTERERFTQTQWDVDEIRRKCMEMELRLKSEQEEKALAEATKALSVEENEALRQELDSVREELEKLQKFHEDSDLKTKSEVKLLVREVKSLRNSQAELRQELDRLAKERTELERRLQKERLKRKDSSAANAKLLNECEILRNRLEECSVNFLIEEESKLKMDTSSLSDAVDLLATSDNRIGLLLAEAQLLAQEVETSIDIPTGPEIDAVMTRDNELRKMLTDVFIDNAMSRKRLNSIIRCILKETEESYETADEDAFSRKTVLGRFLER